MEKQRKYIKKLERAGINMLVAMKALADVTDDAAHKFYRFNSEINGGCPMVVICAIGDRAKELSKFLDGCVELR